MATDAAVGTAVQLSGRDGQGNWILSVIAKRTYRFDAKGAPSAVVEGQPPLRQEPSYAGDGLTLEEDIEAWPFKPGTDLVVRGHAYNHPGAGTFCAAVGAGRGGARRQKRLQVCGERHATVGADGRVSFSAPTVVERVPLSYAWAYGGRDRHAEAKHGNPVERLRRFLPPDTTDAAIADASPFVYPRNPAGRGYLIEPDRNAIEHVALPCLEHPDDLLSPERLSAGGTGRWPAQPVPASLGWLDYGAFPRAAWLGLVHAHDTAAVRNAGEVRLGYCRDDIWNDGEPSAPLTLEGVQGASLGLRFPHFSGGEAVDLINLSPAREAVTVRLPTERPRLMVDGREGRLLPTEPVIDAVIIEPDLQRLTVVWRGSAPARRPYLADELGRMPFEATW